jgi:hypothetical protein
MATGYTIESITVLFIVGMIWLRTRMQYRQRDGGGLQLELAGRIYFGSALAALAIGWLGAPALGNAVWPETGATPTLLRVVWFLATYFVFILVHRVLKIRGTAVFRPEPPAGAS